MTDGIIKYENTKSTKFKLENIDRSSLSAIEYYKLYNEMHPEVNVDSIPTLSVDLDILCVLSDAKYLPDSIRKKWAIPKVEKTRSQSLWMLDKLLRVSGLGTESTAANRLIRHNIESIIHQPIVMKYSNIRQHYLSLLSEVLISPVFLVRTPYDYHYNKLNLSYVEDLDSTRLPVYTRLKNQMHKRNTASLHLIQKEYDTVRSNNPARTPVCRYLTDDICMVTLRCMDNTRTIATYDELNKYLFTMHGDISL